MSRRQIGHNRRECPQGTHVTKCPQGIHANCLSSVKQRTHGLSNVGGSDCLFAAVLLLSDWSIAVLLTLSTVSVTETVGIFCFCSRLSIVFHQQNPEFSVSFCNQLLVCCFSRIFFIVTLGTIILSLLPLITSICLLRIVHAINRSLSLVKSLSKLQSHLFLYNNAQSLTL